MVQLHSFSFALVVNGVEPHHSLQERVQCEVCVRVYRHLEEGREDVVDHVCEHAHL